MGFFDKFKKKETKVENEPDALPSAYRAFAAVLEGA